MAAPLQPWSAVSGIGYDDPDGSPPNPGLVTGRRLKWFGQLNNTDAGNTANQQAGTKALPVVVAGSTATVTVSNTLVTAISLIFLTVKQGTTTPSAGALAGLIVAVKSISAGASFVVEIRNAGSADTLSTDYVVHYWIVN